MYSDLFRLLFCLLSVESKVRSLMPYWYRPTITREEAIGLVQQMDSGAFIVRDSQTVSGGYALTIKVSTFLNVIATPDSDSFSLHCACIIMANVAVL